MSKKNTSQQHVQDLSVIDLKNINLELLSLLNYTKPQKENPGNAFLHYNNNVNFVLKTDRMRISRVTPLYMDLVPVCTKELVQFTNVDKKVIELIHNNSPQWFKKSSFSLYDIDEMFKRTVMGENTSTFLRVYWDTENVNGYDKEHQPIPKTDLINVLVPGCVIKCILRCNPVYFEQSHCILKWDVNQVMFINGPPEQSTNEETSTEQDTITFLLHNEEEDDKH